MNSESNSSSSLSLRAEGLSEVEGHIIVSMFYFIYILRTSSNTLYIGQTNNLERRLKEHKDKKSKTAKYIHYFSSFDLVYKESYPTRLEAMRREIQLKNWTKAKKEALIPSDLNLLKKL